MCLAVPLNIVEMNGKVAVGERHGLRRNIRLDFINNAQCGDYVIVHAGFAIEKIDSRQAEDSLAAIQEVKDALKEL